MHSKQQKSTAIDQTLDKIQNQNKVLEKRYGTIIRMEIELTFGDLINNVDSLAPPGL